MPLSHITKTIGAMVIAVPMVIFPIQSGLAQTDDLSFKLINESSAGVKDFYIVPPYSDDWGQDLVSSVIEPGEAGFIDIQDDLTTCLYDFKIRFTNGDLVEEFDVDICELRSYTITD